ncbi:hypothetical protein NQ318_014621 [Aromia moschata]|uniref:Uncharacterized protein n=1 Tax=Aromia moschata TaxID=1265417 RepID=A0AAV8ZBP8_9CUCU|nr:hypothetical protein NQ318_014621 [Aromia moschata]
MLNINMIEIKPGSIKTRASTVLCNNFRNHMIVVLEPSSQKRTYVQYMNFWRVTIALHFKKLLDQWESVMVVFIQLSTTNLISGRCQLDGFLDLSPPIKKVCILRYLAANGSVFLAVGIKIYEIGYVIIGGNNAIRDSISEMEKKKPDTSTPMNLAFL